jgi:hypothetical protein
MEDLVGRRMADLLAAEHIAHQVRAHKHGVLVSELVRADNRMFLEIARFDRVGRCSRRGVISLMMLDAEFVGRLLSWSDTSVTGLAPAYDMLPMSYAPQQAHLAEAPFEPPLPSAADAAIWPTAYRAALDFWRRVASHRLVSGSFRKLARKSQAGLLDHATLQRSWHLVQSEMILPSPRTDRPTALRPVDFPCEFGPNAARRRRRKNRGILTACPH